MRVGDVDFGDEEDKAGYTAGLNELGDGVSIRPVVVLGNGGVFAPDLQ